MAHSLRLQVLQRAVETWNSSSSCRSLNADRSGYFSARPVPRTLRRTSWRLSRSGDGFAIQPAA